MNCLRKNCRSLLEMMVHGLENANIPTVWRDWDMDKGSLKDQKMRQSEVLLEMSLIILVRLAFHVIMVLPVILTGSLEN